MSKAGPSYSLWLKRRIDEADGLAGAKRAAEYARVRLSIENFKARNLDDLGPGFFDAMLAELDSAAGVTRPQSPKPVEAGAFD
jgi:hypothetical protein